MNKQYGAYFDLNAIPATIRRDWKRYLSKEDAAAREQYWRFLIMKHAAKIANSPESNAAHFKRLFRIGRVALTEQDLHDLELIDERAFARMRTLKVLEVMTPLLPGERVYAKYASAHLKWVGGDGKLRTVLRGELLLTNLRCLIIKNSIVLKDFEWAKTKISIDGILRLEQNGDVFHVYIYDDLTLVQTMQNLLARKVKHDH